MRFKYKTTNIRNDKIPLLEVIITNPQNNNKVSYTALLDSGAFMNVFHSDVAQILGIDLTKIKRQIDFGGVGTSPTVLKGKPYIVNLMVAQKGKSHSFDSYVLFSDDISPNGNPLLGRQGFMDQFSKVELYLKKNSFYLYK
jgi:hypothetical protein